MKVLARFTRHYALLTASLLFLSACGFHAMYGDDALAGKGTPLRGNISIDHIANREGQILKTALEDRFNPEGLNTKSAPYRLNVVIKKTLIPAVVKSDGTIQRYDVRFDSNFKLFRVGVVKPLLTGSIRRTGSYNVAVNANFATYEAEQDVISRTLEEIAEDYVLRISSFMDTMPPEKPLPVLKAASPAPDTASQLHLQPAIAPASVPLPVQ